MLVSSVLPSDVERFGFREGIWVSDYSSLVGLACALRMHLQDIAFEKRAAAGKGEKMEALFRRESFPYAVGLFLIPHPTSCRQVRNAQTSSPPPTRIG